MRDNLVSISRLTFAHHDRLVFDNVDMAIQRGKITAIMGPSGSGKTTLLRLIGALLTPDSGEIYVNGTNIHTVSRKTLLTMRQTMGLLFQNSALFTDLSVFENIAFPLREHSQMSEADLCERVFAMLEAVGLPNIANDMPAELSGGMARRVALARAIALEPALMMYDEPFTGQDPISMRRLVCLIKQLNQSLKITTLLVSHDVEETCAIADYVYLIGKGKVVGAGTPNELRSSMVPEVRCFMHAEIDQTEELLDD